MKSLRMTAMLRSLERGDSSPSSRKPIIGVLREERGFSILRAMYTVRTSDTPEGRARKSLLLRRAVAIIFVLICVGTVSWAIFISYQEETTDWLLNFDRLRLDATSYKVNILSVDEVAAKARANIQMIFDRYTFVELSKTKGPINGKFVANDLDVRIGPLRITDQGPTFESIGFLVLQSLRSGRIPTVPTPDFTTDPPPVSETEFTLIGDSKFYPFDKYIIVGSVSSIVLASANKKDFFSIDSSHAEVYLSAPNFVMRGASNGELLGCERLGATPEGLKLEKKLLEDYPGERQKMFAVLLQRPFFLRFLSIFLLVITLGSATYYAIVSEVKAFALQALGYFVGLWAVRQMLVGGGPKAFTAVDYIVLLLYAALASVVIAKALWEKSVHKFNPPS